MGITTARKLAGDLRKSASNLEKADTLSVEAGALKMTQRLRSAGAAHGPLHGKRGKPIKLGARYVVKRSPDGASAFVKPKPAGAWQIVETGADAHLIGKPARRRRVTYLFGTGYDNPVRGPVAHPGARGSRTWTVARQRAEPEAIKAMQKAPVDAVKHLFRQ